MIRIEEIRQQRVESFPQLLVGDAKTVQPREHFEGRPAIYFLVKLRQQGRFVRFE
jgi:hypothetical protein